MTADYRPDIVERLRRDACLLTEAADEIERVRELYLGKCRELHNQQKAEKAAPKSVKGSVPGIRVVPSEAIRRAISDAV